jgi:hypothetical protein
VEEIRIATWAELHEQLFADSWNEELGLHRSNFAFRGRWDAGDTGRAEVGGPRQARSSQHHGARPLSGLSGLSRWVARYYAPRRPST